jgi:hypothetical protein
MKTTGQNKVGSLLLALFASVCMQAQLISLHSITAARNPNGLGAGYTLDGTTMTQSSRLKLLNPSNFGTAGTYSKTVSIVDAYGTSGSLSQVYTLPYSTLFFFAAFDKLDPATQAFTTAEVDSLYNWSVRGGKMIICSGQTNPQQWGGPPYDSRVLNQKWGILWNYENPVYLVPTPAGNATSIFNGPFGVVTGAYQGGAIQGYFDTTNTNTKVLAKSSNGKATLIMDCNTLDLVVGDVDAYTSLSGITSYTPTITSDQDKFWANTIAFMDQLQPLPVISNNNNLLGLNAAYVSYQWYYNNQPINGAVNATYSLSQTGVYRVEATLNGGCKWRSDSLMVTSISTVSALGPDEELQSGLAPVIYPNPFSSFARIDFKKELNRVVIKIMDEAGREVRSQKFSGQVLNLEREDLEKGIYLMEVSSQGKVLFCGKIIVN